MACGFNVCRFRAGHLNTEMDKVSEELHLLNLFQEISSNAAHCSDFRYHLILFLLLKLTTELFYVYINICVNSQFQHVITYLHKELSPS
jgi:hypothetical protein